MAATVMRAAAREAARIRRPRPSAFTLSTAAAEQR